MNGLCIIPEGRKCREYSEEKAEIYKVSVIHNLDEYLEYANIHSLGVMYLSIKYGLVYADDIIEYSPNPLYKYNAPKLNIWSKIVAEQIYRECLNRFVSKVYFMVPRLGNYKSLLEELKKRGIEVITPFMR